MSARTQRLRWLPLLAAATIGAAAPSAVPAQGTASPAASAELVDGEVRKVDRKAGTILLKHGAIPNLGMPPMSMVFHVKDPSMLDRVAAGDKVLFTAEKIGAEYTVTGVERVR